jgi:hypothetical protein
VFRYQSDNSYWSEVKFELYVRRKSGFYIWKICSVLVTIVLMAIPIFMIDVSVGRLLIEQDIY